MKFFAILAAAVLLGTGSAEGDVLAAVGSEELTWEAFVEMVGGPAAVSSLGITTEDASEEILESWVRERLLLQAANEAGTASKPEVAARIQTAVEQILLEEYITDILGDVEVSRLEVENYVDVWLETYSMEYSVRHILLPDETLASSILSRLNSGESFGVLAADYSVGPSAVSGGNIGWISRGMASPSFMEAVCMLDIGEISGVVETPMGFHVIQLMDRRPVNPAPSRDEIIETATMELVSGQQEIMLLDLIDSLRSSRQVMIWPDRLLNHI